MSSPAGQLREQAASGPRGSPPRLVHPQRPRLRACVTAPSITTSNACREALTSPKSAEKATDLLNRVAVFTSPSVEFPPATVGSLPSQIEAPPGSLPSLEIASGQDMGDVDQSCTSPMPTNEPPQSFANENRRGLLFQFPGIRYMGVRGANWQRRSRVRLSVFFATVKRKHSISTGVRTVAGK